MVGSFFVSFEVCEKLFGLIGRLRGQVICPHAVLYGIGGFFAAPAFLVTYTPHHTKAGCHAVPMGKRIVTCGLDCISECISQVQPNANSMRIKRILLNKGLFDVDASYNDIGQPV